MRCAGITNADGGPTLGGASQRSLNKKAGFAWSLVIPTLKSGPAETLRLKRSAVPGPRLRRGKSACRTCHPTLAPLQPSFRRSRVRLESFRAAEPDCVFDERPCRGAVVEA